jgi:hypothetical protein
MRRYLNMILALFNVIWYAAAVAPTQALSTEILSRYADRILESLQFISTLQPNKLNMDFIAPAEIHMLYKLRQSIKFLIKDRDDTKFNVEGRNPYHCSNSDILQQLEIMTKTAKPLCAEVEWYKIASLSTWNEVSTIYDVGSNKGWLSALFLSLWGGSDLGYTPYSVYQSEIKHGFLSSNMKKDGYCKHGENIGIPLYCPPEARDQSSGKCKYVNNKVCVYSFDGSRSVMKMMRAVMFETKNQSQYDCNRADYSFVCSQYWEHYFTALGSFNGIVNFTQPDLTQTTALNGFEGQNSGYLRCNISLSILGGRMWFKKNPRDQYQKFEVVNVTKLDKFVDDSKSFRTATSSVGCSHKLRNSIDILKIDAESHDRDVLLGAQQAIQNGVKLFSFECAPCPFKRLELESFISSGYECYSGTAAGRF